ncbi:MAG: hypothetical protein J5959_02370 [Butyrivibrio sp.]|nr:hypothetical protein [Butyrivibrio sp.]MBP3242145.1 hypothetical protein [Oribacterium sp.]
MSRLSEVRSMQQEREKNIAKNTKEAELRDLCNILERLNGNIEDLSTSVAMLVDAQTKK